MPALVLSSYAKLNLSLEVLGKRSDGFHELRTIFERISLSDQIQFSPLAKNEVRIHCQHPQVPCDHRNLVYQAAQLLREGEGVDCGVTITIKKNIPVAAGLAGGSTNAATALIGLNQIWNLGLSRQKMLSYAKRLGSDVAFFLYDSSFALGTGRGEKIKPYRLPAQLYHVLVTPKIPLLARDVYEAYAARKTSQSHKLTNRNDNAIILHRSLRKIDFCRIDADLRNDLEKAIGSIAPSLVKMRERIEKKFSKKVLFSGSGPTMFMVVDSFKKACEISTILRKTYKQVFVVQTA